MAAEGSEKGKSVSFTFSKKKTATKLVPNKEYENFDNEFNSGKDFIHSAEGKLLLSVNPKESGKELIIPCLPRNKKLFPHGKEDEVNSLDQQAAEEIINDLSKAERTETETGTNFAIPLLAKTHLVSSTETTESVTETVTETAAVTEESTLEDYDAVPVAEFGAAMLRGMGWKKGEAIGGTNKGLTVPIEFIPRSQGLGLGAERKFEENTKKKRRKPGDVEASVDSGPIIESDGKVRHFKSLDEKIPDKQVQATTYSKGGFVVVESGPHQGLSGKITAVDEDNGRVFVCLAINGEEVTLSQHIVRLVGKDEYKRYSKGNQTQRKENDHRKHKRRKDEAERENNRERSPKKKKKESRDKHKNEHDYSKGNSKDHVKSEPCWMAPLVRVRIISKSFKKGIYYHKKGDFYQDSGHDRLNQLIKVIIQDVTSRTTCICKTDEGRLLEDVPQTALETVIPRNDPRFVLFVQGTYKGLIGEVVQTESSKQQAVIQILRDKSIVKSHYDDISEYVGDVHKE